MADDTTTDKANASDTAKDAPQGASAAKNEPPVNMTDEPISLSQGQASQTVSTDEANAKRGAALEGEPLASDAPVITGSEPKPWAGDTGEPAPDNTFYAATPSAEVPASVLPDDAPAGWVRDIDGSLWDSATIGGLTVEAEVAGRYFVRAYTPHGLKTLSIHTADRQLASDYLEDIALTIGKAKGFDETASTSKRKKDTK